MSGTCCSALDPCVKGNTFEMSFTGTPPATAVYVLYDTSVSDSQPYTLRLQRPSIVTLTLDADVTLDSNDDVTITVELVPANGDSAQSQSFYQTLTANVVQAMTTTLQASVPAGSYYVQGILSSNYGPHAIHVDTRLDVQVICKC